MRIDTRSQRALIWAGVIMANVFTLAFVYLLEFWPLPAPTMGAADVLTLYTRHNLQFKFGVVVMCLSSCFFLPWAVVICAQMARIEKGFPLWTLLAAMANTLGVWLFSFPPILWGVASFMMERNSEITLLMHQFGWLCFVAPANYFLLQTIPLTVVSLSRHNTSADTAFPRWLGWLTIWTGILGSSGVMAFVFNVGPFAWNGIISFYLPLVVFTGWIIAFVTCLLRAIRLQESAA